MYEKKHEQFTSNFDTKSRNVTKKSRVHSGDEVVRSELETMNRAYMELLGDVHHRLMALKHLHDREGLFFPVRCVLMIWSDELVIASNWKKIAEMFSRIGQFSQTFFKARIRLILRRYNMDATLKVNM